VLSKKHCKELLEEFSSGFLETRNLFDVCSHPGCVVAVTHSEKLYLQVHNEANEHGPSFYVYVLP
jgi:hypothetical protein